MTIHPGHHFKSEHGFTGSANPGKDMRPKIPGYKYGGEVTKAIPLKCGGKASKTDKD